MDSEQVRAEMRETRRRIDQKLDLLQARVSESRIQATRAVLGLGGLVTSLYMLSRIRHAWLRRRAPGQLPLPNVW